MTSAVQNHLGEVDDDSTDDGKRQNWYEIEELITRDNRNTLCYKRKCSKFRICIILFEIIKILVLRLTCSGVDSIHVDYWHLFKQNLYKKPEFSTGK